MLSSKIKYFQGEITKKKYQNGQLAIFVNGSDGEPIAELSINDYSIDLASNEIVLKNYSENSQIAKDLLESEVLIPTDRFLLIGTHLCPICEVAF